MKFIIVSLLLAAATALDQEYIDKFMEKLQEIGAECAEEVQASEDDIAELIARKFPPTSHEAKCMLFCMNKRFHLQNEDGSADKLGALQSLEELKAVDGDVYKKVLTVFINCGENVKVDSDPCVTASNMAACAKEEAVAVGLDESLMG